MLRLPRPLPALVAIVMLLVVSLATVAYRVSAQDAGRTEDIHLDVDASSLDDSGRIERGRYLALAGNCASCHTVTADGLMAGGVAFRTDFGTIYSTNITPDVDTGIGSWGVEDFLASMRYGVRPGGDHLYPAFPYTAFTKLADEDVIDLYAYLRSLPPVRRVNTQNELSFPYSERRLLAFWKSLYFEPARFTPDDERSLEWNRGAYLIEGLAHCSECHSPRNRLGATDEARLMSGGSFIDRVPGGGTAAWSAPNLTSAEHGLGMWPAAELGAYLKTGRNTFVETFGPMNEVIANSTSLLTDDDIRAMSVYLKSLPAVDVPQAPATDPRLLGMGRTQYNLHCGTCHLPTGLGDPEMAPQLAQGSLVVRAKDPASLINVILYGPEQAELPSPSPWRKPMEDFQYLLTDDEIAALASFVRSAWGNRADRVTAAEVAAQRSD